MGLWMVAVERCDMKKSEKHTVCSIQTSLVRVCRPEPWLHLCSLHAAVLGRR
jgi:hypothetical protein